jgi:Flp pilus assembly protein TadD
MITTLRDAASLNKAGLDANKAGNSKAALRYFLAATRLAPTDSRYLLSAANMHLKLGEVNDAVDLYENLRSFPLSDKQAAIVTAKLDEVASMDVAGACQ